MRGTILKTPDNKLQVVIEELNTASDSSNNETRRDERQPVTNILKGNLFRSLSHRSTRSAYLSVMQRLAPRSHLASEKNVSSAGRQSCIQSLTADIVLKVAVYIFVII